MAVTDKTLKLMFEKARDVSANAHAPYSRYQVGCCIRTASEHFYVGCNVENAAYGTTQCAECTAIGSMIAAGERKIVEVMLYQSGAKLCMPCGNCRQKLAEFIQNNRVKVHSANNSGIQLTKTMAELLPYSFGPSNLES